MIIFHIGIIFLDINTGRNIIMKLPAFLKQDGDKILYNSTGELVYYIPDRYFGDTKTSIGLVLGPYVSTMGIFDWALVSENGRTSRAKPFKYPTVILCKPDRIEKVKNLSLNNQRPMDYRVLHFKKGDEAISDIHVPRVIDNVELIFSLMVMVENKLPTTIPYDKLQEYFPENMELNGGGYGLSMQLFGIMMSELCRDPEDVSRPFRLSDTIKHSMYGYRQISIKQVPKFVSPFTSLTSENWDDSLMAAVNMSNEGNDTVSPLERVVTG
jgi:hypothetical protein